MGCTSSKSAKPPNTTYDNNGNSESGSSSLQSSRQFNQFYSMKKKTLGEGAFSVVKEAESKKTKESFAVKIVDKRGLTSEDEASLKDEISILKELTHAHVIQLYDVFDEKHQFFLVMERMVGGELFDRVVKKAYYNEKEARDCCRILFEAMAYMHDKRVCHRDLKPENLLLVNLNDDSRLKIADFGFAKVAVSETSLTTQCGTPGYVAPEILESVPYGTKSDMWSLGVIAYILLGGYPPFNEKNDQRKLFSKIRKGDYKFHNEYWNNVSEDAKNLIQRLLVVDPTKRLSAKEALNTKWMTDGDDTLRERGLEDNQKKLSQFNAQRTFKKAVHAVVMISKMESLGKNFRDDLS